MQCIKLHGVVCVFLFISITRSVCVFRLFAFAYFTAMVAHAITIFSFVSTIISPFVRYCNFFTILLLPLVLFFACLPSCLRSFSAVCLRTPYLDSFRLSSMAKRKLFPSTHIDFPISARCVCAHCVTRWWWLFTFI